MKKNKLIRNSTAEFLIFTTQDAENTIEVRYEDETIWLTQKMMAELFEVDIRTINEHLQNIFKSNELDKISVIRKFRTTATDGKMYSTQFYNLDAIISVGYRVNSVRATQFRQWATQVLRQFAIKGFVLDKKRLENGTYLGEDYYEQLLAEIREIRLSERRRCNIPTWEPAQGGSTEPGRKSSTLLKLSCSSSISTTLVLPDCG